MHRKLIAVSVILAFAASTSVASGQDEGIVEDQGIYEEERWNAEKRYDDLEDPSDTSGIITNEQDLKNPSGPDADFEGYPGTEDLETEAED